MFESFKIWKLQKIDFLLTKPIEAYQYGIELSDISFGSIAACVAAGHLTKTKGGMLNTIPIPFNVLSIRRKSIFLSFPDFDFLGH